MSNATYQSDGGAWGQLQRHVMEALNRMRKAADNAIRERARKEAERRVAGEKRNRLVVEN